MTATLSAESADLLERLHAMGMRPYEELGGVLRARSVVESGRWMQGDKAEVTSVRDLLADGGAGRVPVRVYHPSPGEVLPLVVYLHGGGWVAGSVAAADRPCRSLALAGHCAVASVEYRLAPESPFPDGLLDCRAALGWLADNAAEVGADPARIVLCGDSAGANLAAATAMIVRDRGGPRIVHQVLLYPALARTGDFPSRVEHAGAFPLTAGSMAWFWEHYLVAHADGDDPYASPLLAEHVRGLPPTTVVTAEFDPLRDEGEAYAARLRADGVSVELVRYDGVMHGFFWMAGELAAGRALIAHVGSVVRGLSVAP